VTKVKKGDIGIILRILGGNTFVSGLKDFNQLHAKGRKVTKLPMRLLRSQGQRKKKKGRENDAPEGEPCFPFIKRGA